MMQVQAADAAAGQTAAELIDADRMQAKVHPAANCLLLNPLAGSAASETEFRSLLWRLQALHYVLSP